MAPSEQQTALRALVADDDDSVQFMLQAAPFATAGEEYTPPVV
jgi:hypothetical protein